MNTDPTSAGRDNTNDRGTFANACLKSCQAVLTHVRNIKDAIFAEARDTLKVHDQLLRLALNEAEAIAWQTSYPHLFFPALATEKIQETGAWDNRQRAMDRQARSLTF